MLRFCPTRGGEDTRPIGGRGIGLFEADNGFLSFEAEVGVLTAREPRTRLGVVPCVSDMLFDGQLAEPRS